MELNVFHIASLFLRNMVCLLLEKYSVTVHCMIHAEYLINNNKIYTVRFNAQLCMHCEENAG